MQGKRLGRNGGSLIARLPRVGQRIIKTTIAVFLCLLFYCLRGYRGQDMPTEAAITAIVCMQPYVRDTREYARNRFAGTLVGVGWGLLFLLFFALLPALGEHVLVVYTLMALGVLLSLHSAVLIQKPDASGLAAIVFLCVVINFPDIETPLQQALDRFLGVLLGTTVAIAVNVFRLPRTKNRNKVFFVRIRDLAPDRFSPIPPSAQFRLNYLYQDGARICLMSEHAPAFFALQMHDTRFSVPLIVMDGAAIYDANENTYLHTETLREQDANRLCAHLDRLGLSYFVYTVHRNKTCIFHRGNLREEEERIYRRMKRSPYRSYLEEESCSPEEVVYVKIIGKEAEVSGWKAKLQTFLHSRKLRGVQREEAGADGVSALYIYSGKATMRQAQNRLMEQLRKQEPWLEAEEVFSDQAYLTEHDAMQLLNRLGRRYEPLRLPGKRSKASENKGT